PPDEARSAADALRNYSSADNPSVDPAAGRSRRCGTSPSTCRARRRVARRPGAEGVLSRSTADPTMSTALGRNARNTDSTAVAASAPAKTGTSRHLQQSADPEERSDLEPKPEQHRRETGGCPEGALDVSSRRQPEEGEEAER